MFFSDWETESLNQKASQRTKNELTVFGSPLEEAGGFVFLYKIILLYASLSFVQHD